jgi:sugar phosphate permease
MVASACGLQFMQSGLLLQSLGAYIAVLREEFGWSKTALSGAAVIMQMENALLGPIQGWIADRFGPRGMILGAIVVFGLGFILLGRVESLAGFYGAFLVLALGSALSGYFPLTVTLVHWFERKRARALSSMQLGFAAGGMAVPAVAWSLLTFGWRETAFASGVLIIVLGLPLASMLRARPEDHGETVDGEPASSDRSARAGDGMAYGERDYTAKEALRTPAFWFISFGHGFSLLTVSAVNVHAITHMKEGLGYSISTAALVIGVMTFSQFAGILLAGTIGDRFEKRILSAECMVLHMVGLVFLTYAAGFGMVIAFAVVHGLAWGLRGPLMGAIRADYFGRSSIGLIMGFSSMVALVGQVSGPMIAGILADATGNYRAGFTVVAVLSGLGSVFFFFARPPHAKARIRR